jgi:hypothetical protein
MNNNLKLINKMGKKYYLTPEQFNLITVKYQNDTRDYTTLEKELTNICEFYRFKNNQNITITRTPPLTNGNNYYVTAFDQNSNLYLEPVSITLTNPEKSEILVNNSFKGYQKHTQVDDIEIAICQIGKALNFDIVEEYRIYNQNKQKDSIIIKDIVNDNEFYDVEDLHKRFDKLIIAGKLRKESWIETSENLKVANTKEDYKVAIDYGLNVLKSLPSMLEEDYQQIEKKYFQMLLFDSLINQSERNFKDYGILCDKETKRYKFAPLFDNVFPTILKNNDVFSFNGIICNRYELMECLFFNYYDKIQDKVEFILNNKQKVLTSISNILKYNLDFNNYNMTLNNFLTNINYFEKLIQNKKIIEKQESNAGFVDIVQMVVALTLVIVFSICIAYLLYCIK